MILSDKEKKCLVDNLIWMIKDIQYKSDETKLNCEKGSEGDYSPKLKEAMSLLEDIQKTETTEITGRHRKSVTVNCREFACRLNRQGTCALSAITLEKISEVLVGRLKCVQAEEKEEEKSEPEKENQKHTKPCPYDNSVPCVQHDGDDCGCDPCEQCEVKLEAEH